MKTADISGRKQVNGRAGDQLIPDAESTQNRTNGGKMAPALPGQLGPGALLTVNFSLVIRSSR